MSNFAIMRCAKIKNIGNLSASLKHNFREIETHNADSSKTHLNEHMTGITSSDQATKKLKALLPEKRRKDAVICVEYLCTASPEWFQKATPEEQNQFFTNAKNWLAEKYGVKNIFTCTIQRDETTPHLSAFVAPITPDGRLSAKEFIGNKAKMSQDQTSFAKAVENLGLRRGQEKSKAKHQSIRAYYHNVNQAEKISDALTTATKELEKFTPEEQQYHGKMPLTGRQGFKAAIDHALKVTGKASEKAHRLNLEKVSQLVESKRKLEQEAKIARIERGKTKAKAEAIQKQNNYLKRKEEAFKDFKKLSFAEKALIEAHRAKELAKKKTKQKNNDLSL